MLFRKIVFFKLILFSVCWLCNSFALNWFCTFEGNPSTGIAFIQNSLENTVYCHFFMKNNYFPSCLPLFGTNKLDECTEINHTYYNTIDFT